MPHVILNHHLILRENAFIPIDDRGFRYGDGVFETIAIHGGVPYQFEWHIGRLKAGLAALRIDCDFTKLADDCRRLVRHEKPLHALLRIQVTRGSAGRGYLPMPAPCTSLIEILPIPPAPPSPVSLWLSSYRKPSAQSLPVAHKLCQGLNSTLARMEADTQGCFDALLQNQSGYIAETSSANIFWLKDNVLYTPSLDCDILNGAMRSHMLRLSPLPVREVSTDLDELREAECVFITNSVWQILQVSALLPAGRQWLTQPIIAELQNALDADMAAYSSEHKHFWEAT